MCTTGQSSRKSSKGVLPPAPLNGWIPEINYCHTGIQPSVRQQPGIRSLNADPKQSVRPFEYGLVSWSLRVSDWRRRHEAFDKATATGDWQGVLLPCYRPATGNEVRHLAEHSPTGIPTNFLSLRPFRSIYPTKQLMRRILVVLGLVTLIFSACVPNKKIVYYQKQDLKNRAEIPKDSVLRTYDLKINDYTIQPLDILSITFETLSEENDAFDFLSKLSPQTRGGNIAANAALLGIFVDSSGDIEYPILGKITVAGLTIFEAQRLIQEIAAKYIPDVAVRVRMLNFRYTVLGEVNEERTITSNNPRLTMSEAIGMAGGFGELADRSHVKIIRQSGSQAKVYYVNLLEENFVESPFYYVQQNDVIVVPPLRQRPFRRYFSSNMAVLASTISLVLVVFSLTR